MKQITELTWQVPEEEYRQSKALHYSTLSRYAKEGFKGIPHLFDKVESPALTFGSMVDTYLTDGIEEFNKQFAVYDIPTIPVPVQNIVKAMYEENKLKSFDAIPDAMLLEYCKRFDYCTKFKPETQLRNIKAKGKTYYDILTVGTGKTIVDLNTYNAVMQVINTLQASDTTKWYFHNNPFEEKVQKYYQPKFKATLQGIEYTCMFDILIVNYDTKQIMPCDLKTTGKAEYEFFKSFIEWNYQIQARLYTRILQEVIRKDEYFKDFEILPFRFIVVNKVKPNPMVWTYEDTFKYGTLYYGKSKQIECKDPEELGKELSTYLNGEYTIPVGMSSKNELTQYLQVL